MSIGTCIVSSTRHTHLIDQFCQYGCDYQQTILFSPHFGYWKGFPSSSNGKESTCNAGDPSSIPGLGQSPGEGIGYPLQYLQGSLVAQTVKNLPVMWKTWVLSLFGKTPWRRAWQPTRVFLPAESPWTENMACYWKTFKDIQENCKFYEI